MSLSFEGGEEDGDGAEVGNEGKLGVNTSRTSASRAKAKRVRTRRCLKLFSLSSKSKDCCWLCDALALSVAAGP